MCNDDYMMDRIQHDLLTQASTGRHRDPQHRAWAVERLATAAVSKLAQRTVEDRQKVPTQSRCAIVHHTCHDRNEMKWTPCGPNSKRNVRTL